MKKTCRCILGAGFLLASLGVLGLDGLADGIVTELPASPWTTVLGELKSLKFERAPYHLLKRSRAYDHDILIETPMARAAAYVQANKKDPKALAPEAVARAFDPSRLIIETKTFNHAIEHSQGVLLALRVDGRVLQPVKDDLISTTLKSVGFYADPLYVTIKQFMFSMDDIRGAKAMSVMIIEPDNTTYELPLDLARLK